MPGADVPEALAGRRAQAGPADATDPLGALLREMTALMAEVPPQSAAGAGDIAPASDDVSEILSRLAG